MIFDGKFQVTRGDVFTTGLKYNHTSVYQQKVDYYRTLLTESLENNGLTVYKCDIHGFGTGPLIQVDFRVFLDMRKVPMLVQLPSLIVCFSIHSPVGHAFYCDFLSVFFSSFYVCSQIHPKR